MLATFANEPEHPLNKPPLRAQPPGLSMSFQCPGDPKLIAHLECTPKRLLALYGPTSKEQEDIERIIDAIMGVPRPAGSPAYGWITAGCEDEDVWFHASQKRHVASQHRAVGLVLCQHPFLPAWTVQQHLLHAVSEQSKDPQVRQGLIAPVVAQLDLAGILGRYPKQLDSEQRCRLAIAQAIARQPKVLILDRPFSHLPSSIRRRMQRLVAEQRSHWTCPVLFHTEDLQEAALVGDEMVLVHQGETVQHGSWATVMSQPRDADIARLIGHRNVFMASIAEHYPATHKTILQWADQRLEVPLTDNFRPGTVVDWMIPAKRIALHNPLKPALTDQDNPMTGIVDKIVSLGDAHEISVRIGIQNQILVFDLTTSVMQRLHVKLGSPLPLSLPKTFIHVMARSQFGFEE